jgi:hypothetical protein
VRSTPSKPDREWLSLAFLGQRLDLIVHKADVTGRTRSGSLGDVRRDPPRLVTAEQLSKKRHLMKFPKTMSEPERFPVVST